MGLQQIITEQITKNVPDGKTTKTFKRVSACMTFCFQRINLAPKRKRISPDTVLRILSSDCFSVKLAHGQVSLSGEQQHGVEKNTFLLLS